MCTAAVYRTQDYYFGRTLDHTRTYAEEITVTPRRFPLTFGDAGRLDSHYAYIGMAYVADGYPLYYDAVNEKGLGMAGLHFVGQAVYRPVQSGMDNIPPYALIPWVLGQCASVSEARALLARTNLIDRPFRPDLPTAELHWMLSDGRESIVVEPGEGGLQIYPNPVEVLTNNPPFPQQRTQLNNYMHLSPRPPENRFAEALPLRPYSNGMGALGLPGDLSSPSRFVRAAFMRANSVSGTEERESVGQFFHILGTVEQPRGCCLTEKGELMMTRYTSCCNAVRGIYYYTTYENRQISAVDMYREDLDSSAPVRYPIIREEQIFAQN